MWKRLDTQRKRSPTMKADQRSTTSKTSLKDSKITVFIGLWAFVATLLLIIKTSSHGKVSAPEHGRSRYEIKQIWHGGSPTDLYKGSCYCGGDKYCMCTPSLAIDAIIEVHSSRPDVGTNAQEGEGDWPMSRKSCLAIRGQIPHGENDLNGQDTVKSAPLVRAAKEAALKDQFSTGKTRALGDFNDISNKIPGNMLPSTALNRIHIDSSQRLRRRRIQRGLNTRALPALNSTLESGSGLMGNKKDKKSGISIVLVFRRDPPSGFAIPGGFVEVGESVEHATAREVKEETNLDLLSVELFRIYSDPHRDARRHTVSAVFRCIAKDVSMLKKGDDAKDVRIVALEDVLRLPLAFDHKQILSAYISLYHPSVTS